MPLSGTFFALFFLKLTRTLTTCMTRSMKLAQNLVLGCEKCRYCLKVYLEVNICQNKGKTGDTKEIVTVACKYCHHLPFPPEMIFLFLKSFQKFQTLNVSSSKNSTLCYMLNTMHSIENLTKFYTCWNITEVFVLFIVI